MTRAQREYVGVAVALIVIIALGYAVSQLKYRLAQEPCVVTGFKAAFGIRNFAGCK